MLQDVYLHTNCLATLANMAPHVHRLSAYASQRLVSLFYMLSRKYTKLEELRNDKLQISKGNSMSDLIAEDMVVYFVFEFYVFGLLFILMLFCSTLSFCLF